MLKKVKQAQNNDCQYTLTTEEDKLMDVIVSHFVDTYFENPKRFVEPVTKKVNKKPKKEIRIK